MNPFMQALSFGYSQEQILKFIQRAFPDLAKKITKATAAGYSLDKVFNLLAKTSQPEQTGRMYQSERHAKMQEEQRDIGKNLAKTGAALAGGTLAARALPGALQKAGQFLGIPSPMQQTPGQAITQNIASGEIKEPITQEQVNTAPQYQPEYDYLERKKLAPKIQTMVKAGKTKEEIIEMLKKKMPMMEQEALRTLGPGGREIDLDTKLDNIVDKFFSPARNVPRGTEEKISTRQLPESKKSVEKPNQTKIDLTGMGKGMMDNFYEGIFKSLSEGKDTFAGVKDPLIQKAKPEFEKGNIKSPEDLRKFAQTLSQKKVEKPIEVGSEVITPSGDIAKIDVLPGNTAKVDVDGKKHVFETKTLTPVPQNKEEILQIYDKLINAIPEEARSTMVAAIGFDQERKKLQVKFHDGSSYNYDDLDKEDIDSILNLEHLAKTSGGNYFGVYFEGEPSLGAGISKMIQRLQKKYGGKGKEYSGKFKELYSLYGIPEGLRREREKKEREERKRAKRNA